MAFKSKNEKKNLLSTILMILIILILIVTGCKQPDSSAQSGANLNGTITISGAWALYPMMIRWSEEYQKLYPDIMFDISAGGAGKGMADALAVEPEALLCDEPTSALDPISAQRIEEQLKSLKEITTIVLVTHLLRQARRLADHVIFLWMGELVETGPACQVFNDPQDERTRAYLAGDIG